LKFSKEISLVRNNIAMIERECVAAPPHSSNLHQSTKIPEILKTLNENISK